MERQGYLRQIKQAQKWQGFCGSLYLGKCAAPRQNKQNDCAPSEGSDQPGHLPSLIRVFAVRMKKSWVLSYPFCAQRRLWSDWTDAQADQSLRWAHMPFRWFCHEAAQKFLCLIFSLSAWRNLGSSATHSVHSEDSDQTGQMPRLISLRWAHMPFRWFCHEAAQMFLCLIFFQNDYVAAFCLNHYHTRCMFCLFISAFWSLSRGGENIQCSEYCICPCSSSSTV